MSTDEEAQHRTLRAMGLTLLGIVVSVATTVGFGLSGPWWLRAGAGVLTVVALLAAIKAGTAEGGRGPVARVADWVTGEGRDRSRSS